MKSSHYSLCFIFFLLIISTCSLGQSADLDITKNDGVSEVTAGDGVVRTYTIRVTNIGEVSATNVLVTDTWPAGFTLGSLSTSTGIVAIAADGNFTWSIDVLAPGESRDLTATYIVPSTTNSGAQTNTVTVSSSTTDLTPGNNTASDVNFVNEDVTLTIAKDFLNPGNDATGDTPEETAIAGSTGKTFFIVVTNTGVSTADNVTIRDIVPTALTVTNVTGTLGAQVSNPTLNDNNIEWLIPTLGAGQSVTLTVTYSVGSDVNTQLVTNTADVFSSETVGEELPPIPDSDDVQIVENVVLVNAKDFSNPANDAAGDTPEETVTAGSNGNTFSIVVTNTGISTADNVMILDQVPPALTVTNVTGTLGTQVANPTLNDALIEWFIPSLGGGQSVTIVVTYSVAPDINRQLVTNLAGVASDETIAFTVDGDDVQIEENVVLTIDKEFQDASVIAGTDGHTFTITVTNIGLSDSDNLVIDDLIPPTLVWTNVTMVPATTFSIVSNSIHGTLDHLAPGQSTKITVTYSVPISIPTSTISNTATAGCDEVSPVSDSDVLSVINNTICPRGKGYWKNHPEEWPVNGLTLGAITYDQTQLLIILNLPVGNGNGNGGDASIILAQQLIAAKLNVAFGVDAASIASIIGESDILLSNYAGLLPYKVKPNSAAGQMMIALASDLENFNSGLLTVGCFMPPVVSNSSLFVTNEVVDPMQRGFVLEQNSPNPARNITSIRYELPLSIDRKNCHVTLKVYDMFGREIAMLVNALQEAGTRSVQFDVGRLSAGIYFYRLTAGSFSESKKMVVVK